MSTRAQTAYERKRARVPARDPGRGLFHATHAAQDDLHRRINLRAWAVWPDMGATCRTIYPARWRREQERIAHMEQVIHGDLCQHCRRRRTRGTAASEFCAKCERYDRTRANEHP